MSGRRKSGLLKGRESLPLGPKRLLGKDIPSIAKFIASRGCRNIFVVVGAGISTSAGIPDFRSPNTGLYSNLDKLKLPEPTALFDFQFFRDNPVPFYTIADDLYPGKFNPTLTHAFIRLLSEKGLLHTCFTQNIDTLEARAGVPPDQLVEAHGSFATQSCIDCKKPYPDDKMKHHITKHKVPKCLFCGGLVKPDIIFFGEPLPKRYTKSEDALKGADLLIIMGTSLSVPPVAYIPDHVPPSCPRILFNKAPVGDIGDRADDVSILQDCDTTAVALCEALGWKDDLNRIWTSVQRPREEESGAESSAESGSDAESGEDSDGQSGEESEEEPEEELENVLKGGSKGVGVKVAQETTCDSDEEMIDASLAGSDGESDDGSDAASESGSGSNDGSDSGDGSGEGSSDSEDTSMETEVTMAAHPAKPRLVSTTPKRRLRPSPDREVPELDDNEEEDERIQTDTAVESDSPNGSGLPSKGSPKSTQATIATLSNDGSDAEMEESSDEESEPERGLDKDPPDEEMGDGSDKDDNGLDDARLSESESEPELEDGSIEVADALENPNPVDETPPPTPAPFAPASPASASSEIYIPTPSPISPDPLHGQVETALRLLSDRDMDLNADTGDGITLRETLITTLRNVLKGHDTRELILQRFASIERHIKSVGDLL